MRTPLVRNMNKVSETTRYRLNGFFLTEKMKGYLRGRGVKTEDKTWAEVFPNADVVYRFNPDKNKADVFVGSITSRIEGTRNRQLETPPEAAKALDIIYQVPSDYRAYDTSTFVIGRDQVKRLY